MRAQLDGFLDDALDDFPFRNRDEQGDGAGRWRLEIFQRHGKCHRIARTIFNRAKKFVSRAVQNRDKLAVFHAQNLQRMMRLARVEPEHLPGATFWRQIKSVHK